MNETQINVAYFWGLGVFTLVLIVLSILPLDIPPPEEWLLEWTDWFVQVGIIATAGRGVWIVSTAAADRLRR